jgi:ribosome biogenesis protein ENP2
VPKFIRDLFYHRPTCDAYVACSGEEVYRLNLEQGSFLAPLNTSFENGVNVIGSNPVHPILAFGGGEGGRVECWDPRDRTRASILDVPASIIASHPAIARAFKQAPKPIEITALRFDDSGMNLCIGTNNGQVLTYDIRAGAPYFAKDHRYGTAINSIKYHESSGKLLTADSKMIRIWDKTTGDAFTSIQAPGPINDVSLVGESGMLLMACDLPSMHMYYVPALGSVPDWCAQLEGLTEEMEETKQNAIYDDYKFVTREQLQDWGLSHLIGTNLLRAYMHGFFMDTRFYEQVRIASVDPEDYSSYVKDQVRRKIDEERSNRITAPSKLPQVNKDLASAMMAKQQSTKRKAEEATELIDKRFASVFEDEDFAVDAASDEYRRLNPHLNQRKVVSGEVRHVAKPSADDASMGDLLSEEANPLADKTKRSHEMQGLIASAGLEEDDMGELSSKEIRKREKAATLAAREGAEAAQHAAEAKAMLRDQQIKDKFAMFANSIASKKQRQEEEPRPRLRSVRAGVGIGDVLNNTKAASRPFAHLSMAERVKAEEAERIRVYKERERGKRTAALDEKNKAARADEARALQRRTMSHNSMVKKGIKPSGKGSKNEYK